MEAASAHLRLELDVGGRREVAIVDTAACANLISEDRAKKMGVVVEPLAGGDATVTRGLGGGAVRHVGRATISVEGIAQQFLVHSAPVPQLLVMAHVLLDAAPPDMRGTQQFLIQRRSDGGQQVQLAGRTLYEQQAEGESNDTLFMRLGDHVMEVSGDNLVAPNSRFAQVLASLAPETPLTERPLLRLRGRSELPRVAVHKERCTQCARMHAPLRTIAHTRCCNRCVRAEEKRRAHAATTVSAEQGRQRHASATVHDADAQAAAEARHTFAQWPAARDDGDAPHWALAPEAPPAATTALQDPCTPAQHRVSWQQAIAKARLRGKSHAGALDAFAAMLEEEPAVYTTGASKADSVVPRVCAAVHKIVLHDRAELAKVLARPHKRSAEKQRVVNEYLQALVETGRVRPSRSPVSSVPVVAAKINSAGERVGWRVAIDFRALNAQTLHDAYPAPDARTLLFANAAYPWRTILDCLSQFWSVPLSASSVPLTATDFGDGRLWEWLVAPFGLRSMPATLQRFADQVFASATVGVYADDVIVGHVKEDGKEMAAELMVVLRRALAARVTFGLDKAQLFVRRAELLGHEVAFNAVHISSAKALSIADAPVPTSPTALLAFCNRVAFFTHDVPNVSVMLAPLRAAAARRGSTQWAMTAAESDAYEVCVEALRRAAPLRRVRSDRMLFVHTDGSRRGFAYIAYHESKDGKPQELVAVASRALREGEAGRDVPDLEFSAFAWAAAHLEHMLANRHFTWRCDNTANMQVAQGSKNTRGRLQRQHAFLAGLSYTAEWCRRDTTMASIVDGFSKEPQLGSPAKDEPTFWCAPEKVEEEEKEVERGGDEEWKKEVLEDEALQGFRAEAAATAAGRRKEAEVTGGGSVASTAFFDAAGYLRVQVKRDGAGYATPRVVPRTRRAAVLNAMHGVKHLRPAAMHAHALTRYYWPTMRRDVQQLAARCQYCQLRAQRTPGLRAAGPTAANAGDVVFVDHYGVRLSVEAVDVDGNRQHGTASIMLTVDQATRLVVASAVADRSMAAAACAFEADVVPMLDVPRLVLTDSAFAGDTHAFGTMCRRLNIARAVTAPYSTRARAWGERPHAEFSKALAAVMAAAPGPYSFAEVGVMVRRAQHAVNTAPQSVLGGISAHEALYGVPPRDLVDIELGWRDGKPAAKTLAGRRAAWSARAQELKVQAQRAYLAGADAAQRSQRLRVGELVTVMWPSVGDKLAPARRTGVWRVLAVSQGGTVAVVAPRDVPGATRLAATAHCRVWRPTHGLAIDVRLRGAAAAAQAQAMHALAPPLAYQSTHEELQRRMQLVGEKRGQAAKLASARRERGGEGAQRVGAVAAAVADAPAEGNRDGEIAAVHEEVLQLLAEEASEEEDGEKEDEEIVAEEEEAAEEVEAAVARGEDVSYWNDVHALKAVTTAAHARKEAAQAARATAAVSAAATSAVVAVKKGDKGREVSKSGGASSGMSGGYGVGNGGAIAQQGEQLTWRRRGEKGTERAVGEDEQVQEFKRSHKFTQRMTTSPYGGVVAARRQPGGWAYLVERRGRNGTLTRTWERWSRRGAGDVAAYWRVERETRVGERAAELKNLIFENRRSVTC